MRTTIDLPDELFRLAKATAALRGIKLRELITDCLTQGLEAEGHAVVETAVPKTPRRVSTSRDTGPIPGMSPQQMARIFNEDEARVYLAARRRLEAKAAHEPGA